MSADELWIPRWAFVARWTVGSVLRQPTALRYAFDRGRDEGAVRHREYRQARAARQLALSGEPHAYRRYVRLRGQQTRDQLARASCRLLAVTAAPDDVDVPDVDASSTGPGPHALPLRGCAVARSSAQGDLDSDVDASATLVVRRVTRTTYVRRRRYVV